MWAPPPLPVGGLRSGFREKLVEELGLVDAGGAGALALAVLAADGADDLLVRAEVLAHLVDRVRHVETISRADLASKEGGEMAAEAVALDLKARLR